MGSPFDYPLSSRLDENDAIFIMDKVLVPWENVFVYGDIDKANNFFPRTGFLPRFVVHGCTRLAVKLDFIAGLLLKAVEAAGTKDYRGVQANVGEVIAWRNLFWGLSDAMVRDPRPWIGDYVLPNMNPGSAYQIIATMAYSKVKYIIEQTVASGLIYLNSHARDFQNAEMRPYLDRYLRGSNGYKAEERVKLMKLLWDCISTEFGGRHELYEINYGGSTEEIRRYALFGAQASGNAEKFMGFAEQCMAEYDLDGWRVPDLTDPGRTQLSCDAQRRLSGRGCTNAGTERNGFGIAPFVYRGLPQRVIFGPGRLAEAPDALEDDRRLARPRPCDTRAAGRRRSAAPASSGRLPRASSPERPCTRRSR